MVLGVEHLVANSALRQKLAEILALLNARSSNQNRLAGSVTLGDVFDNHCELDLFVLVDQVALVFSDHWAVGWDWHHTELVGAHKLGGFGLCGTGHTGKL